MVRKGSEFSGALGKPPLVPRVLSWGQGHSPPTFPPLVKAPVTVHIQ